MYILQISDLHVSNLEELEVLKEKIKRLGACLGNSIPEGSQIICCLLGDFVEKGDFSLFSTVKKLLAELQKELNNITNSANVAWIIVPGNHDLCYDSKVGKKTLYAFNEFASAVTHAEIAFSDECSIFEADHFGYHIISISSVLNSEYSFGAIDYNLLNKCNFPANTIVVTHHSLISGDSGDNAVIRNGYELQTYLETRNVVALLHGHTHGCKRYTVGQDCQVIGVGPMFKPVPDISNQCNVIHIDGNSVRKITTLLYQDDRKVWDSVDTYEKHVDSNYHGTSVFDVYTHVLRDAESNLLLPNLRIQIKQKYDSFQKEVWDCFGSCMEDAQIWQGNECPQELEYTHGQLMTYRDISWDQYVCETLIQNPTSKRAIVPLIDKEMSFRGGDDKLVSFDVVQFGFSNADCKDLHITVYFRALEIRYFLPLNICEVFLMAQKIKKHIQSIDSLTICFFAYRAEAKKNYGCYKKATIDMLSESELCKILASKNYDKLSKILDQKADMGDTVIDLAWLDKVQHALDVFYEEKNKNDVLQQVNTVRKKLSDLKDLRAHCSDYSKTQQQEDEFTNVLRLLSSMLKEVENG